MSSPVSSANATRLLTVLPATQTYRVATASTVQVNQQVGLSKSEATFRQTLLETLPTGYVFQTEQLATHLQNTDPGSLLLAEFNALNERLVLGTDQHGNLTGVLNAPELVTRWQEVRARVSTTYARLPSLPGLLAALDQQLEDPATLLAGMRHKGAFGLLYAGVWGRPAESREPVVVKQVLKNYLGPLDLPLQLTATSALDPRAPGEVLVTRTGTLDQTQWDPAAFRHLLRGIMDSFSLKTELRLACHELYRLNYATGWLLEATQQLRLEVPGAYLNEAHHTLTPLTK